MGAHAAVLAAYLALGIVFTWPLAPRAAGHVLAHGVREATPALNIWAMAVVLHRLPRDPIHLFDGNAFHPYSNTLAFSEHLFVPALMASPVVAATGNWVLAYNVVTLLTLSLAGWGMFLLAREVTGDATAAFVAGGLYALHTWNINEVVRLQILSNQFFPFLLWALVRFFREPGWAHAAASSAFYLLQSLSCMYFALYAPIVVAVAIAVLAWRYRPTRGQLLRLGLAFVPALAILGIFAIPYVRSAQQHAFTRPEPEPLSLARYLDVLPNNILYAGALGTAGPNQNAAHFLGFFALALFSLGAWPRREADGSTSLRPLFLVLALGGFVLSLGPRLRIGDEILGPAPYLALQKWAPGFRNVRYPERFAVVSMLGFALLVAAGLRDLRPRLRTGGLAVVGGLALLEHLSIPQQLDPLAGGAAIPEVYRRLAENDDVRVTAEVPASRHRLERFDALGMYYSTAHWKRTLDGFTGYFPPTYNFSKWRLFHFPAPSSVEFLRRFGVDTVVVRPEGAVLASRAGPWTSEGPHGGYRLLRLHGASLGPDVPLPAAPAAGVEIPRVRWTVQASSPGAPRAIDGDRATAWATPQRQEKGEFYRVQFDRPTMVSRISLAVGDPYEFPMRLRLVGQEPDGSSREIEFDETAAYERLFALLLHRPREASLDLDVPPQLLRGFRLRLTETDPFWMPWTMAEVRAFGPP